MTEIAWPCHLLVLGCLVSLEIMDSPKGLCWAQFTTEGHVVCLMVVNHDGPPFVLDHRHALCPWQTGQCLGKWHC